MDSGEQSDENPDKGSDEGLDEGSDKPSRNEHLIPASYALYINSRTKQHLLPTTTRIMKQSK